MLGCFLNYQPNIDHRISASSNDDYWTCPILKSETSTMLASLNEGTRMHSLPILSNNTHRKELSELNDELANCIERIVFLEAYNTTLNKEVECFESSADIVNLIISSILNKEIDELTNMITKTHQEKLDAEKKLKDLGNQLDELNKVMQSCNNDSNDGINDMIKTIAHNEAKNNFLKRSIKIINYNITTLKHDIDDLNDYLEELNTLNLQEKIHICQLCERKNDMLEKLRAMKNSHQREVRQLITDKCHFDDFPFDYLSNAIKAIRQEQETQMKQQNRELNQQFIFKYQPFTMQLNKSTQNKGITETSNIQHSKFESLQRDVSVLKSQNQSLHDNLQSINKMIEEDREKSERVHVNKLQLIQHLKQNLEIVTQDYDHISQTRREVKENIDQYGDLLNNGENGLKQIIDSNSQY